MSLKFSQRIGITPLKTTIQINSMDEDLRNSLWNIFNIFFVSILSKRAEFKIFFTNLWINYFKKPIDSMPEYFEPIVCTIRQWFFNWKWNEVYDFIDFLASTDLELFYFIDLDKFIKNCNVILEKENSGFRFINKKLSPITNEIELKEIEDAIINAKSKKLSGVELHLKSALDKLSDRKKPDFRNSIKEAICAIESLCQLISNSKKATLSGALKIIEKNKLIELHPALKEGFIKLYGYSSDSDGIRHALLEKDKLEFDDAKYIIVSASAFINYLIVKADKAKVKLF